MTTTGFTLGKFAPFHKGHQYIIDTALKEVDKLIVVIYDSPDVTDIPLQVRANWIRKLYPMVEVIEAWNGPNYTGDSPQIKQIHEKYLLNLLKDREITHFYSSEFYGEHISKAFKCFNRQVDPQRRTFNISASEIRQNPYHHRANIDPIVYQDFVTNIVFLGAPSTGKTTLSTVLAEEFNTVWMPEYGRDYWEEHQIERRLTPEQLLEIAKVHLDKENKYLQEANQFLFTDTNAITTYIFALEYHGQAPPQLKQLALENQSRYDLFFLCDTDIPYEDTWERSGDANRIVMQKQIIADLAERKLPYIRLTRSLDERIRTVKTVLAKFKKYNNPLNYA